MGPKFEGESSSLDAPDPARGARPACGPVLEIDKILEKKSNRKIFFFLSRTKVPNCPL